MINFFNDFINPIDAQRSLQRSALRDQLEQQFPSDQQRVDAQLRKWELANPRSNACSVHDVLDHIDHVINVAGIDHVGLGSDYDGIPATPTQLGDVSTFPVITQGLLDRGYSEAEIRKVLGENVLRVFREAEAVASR
jgi:membrane dipeptidase